jgi:hypothetical protein
MAASRLTDSQKSELVARYRQGAASQDLAEAFGCSANTVSRVVKAALDPEEYERLKQERSRQGRSRSRAETSVPAAAGEGGDAEPEVPAGQEEARPVAPVSAEGPGRADRSEETEEEDGPGVLAIDDAEDFGGDGDEEDDLGLEEEGSDEEFVTVPVMQAGVRERAPEPVPLQGAALPASVYMLVDKTVELQARPLSEFPELGPLPPQELERQALVVFANPRQAKRQCGRSQRVIKLPDVGVLERTASYLVAQGITRVVMEGALYSLPGS